jgi:endoglucanase Acf2
MVNWRTIVIMLGMTAVLSGCFFAKEQPSALLDPEQSKVKVGHANIHKTLEGTAFQGPQQLIYRTERLTGPMPTNDWWSSAAWMPFSGAMYPHPLAVKASSEGLGIASPPMQVRSNSFHSLYSDGKRDLLVGGDGLVAESALVDGFSDWTVSLLFENMEKTRSMKATIAHGSPYAYFVFDGTKPHLKLAAQPEWYVGSLNDHAFGITLNGNHYGVFAPTGTTWMNSEDGGIVAKTPNRDNYLSIVLLPDNSPETFHAYAKYAYSFITDSRVDWTYDEEHSLVTSTFKLTTKAMEGEQKGTIIALLPHQWKSMMDQFLPYEYDSPRGIMKTVEGNEFRTEMHYRGILPYLPNIGTDETILHQQLDDFIADQPLIKPGEGGEGTYWYGKNYGRLSQIMPIAEQLGRADIVEAIEQAMMTDMATAFRGEDNRLAYYDSTWGTLNMYPTQFGADMVLNDHHFHYGYWVYAAALLAYRHPDWVSDDEYGQMIELLIADYANWRREDNEHATFPFLRTFDPYEGHSWASGPAQDGSGYSPGNNQEASSEAIHAAAAMILWGDATSNKAIRDTGVYLYTTEVEAIRNYWFDVDGDNLPETYDYDYVPLLFSSGGEYRTWWTNNPEEVHGINFLPMTGASLYLGWDQAYAKSNYEFILKQNDGPEQEWKDLIWMYEALFEPEQALAKFSSGGYVPEYGESIPHTYQWIANMAAIGAVDPTIIADTPLYAVFKKGGKQTFIAYNSSNTEITVTFRTIDSSKTMKKMKVPAKTMIYSD